MDIGFPTPELLSALRGWPGQIFVRDQEFKVNENNPICLHIPNSQLDVARSILPLATNYKIIQDYIEIHYSGDY